MAQSASASAGPNAVSPAVVAMRDGTGQPPITTGQFKTDEIFSPMNVPSPLLLRWPEYPLALPMCTDDPGHYHLATTVNRSSAIVVELTIQLDHPTVSSSTSVHSSPLAMRSETNGGLCTICRSETHTYYRPQMPLHKVIEQTVVDAAAAAAAPTTGAISEGGTYTTSSPIPTHLLPYVSLYDAQKQPVWTLTTWNRQALEFVAQHQKQPHRVSLLTTTLSFQWINGQTYQWRLIPSSTNASYDLRCYYQDGKLVAEFIAGSRYIVWPHTSAENKTNPFRQSLIIGDRTTTAANDSGDRNLNGCGSGSGISDAGDGQGDLLSTFLLLTGLLLLDNLRSTAGMTTQVNTEEDDAASVGSSMYYADQGLVDASPTTGRWYGGSAKSIELDPGMMHCWWGIGCCWSWCPCCMPGGWFDRLRWSLLRRKHDDIHASIMPRSRQRRQPSWQQHHSPDQY